MALYFIGDMAQVSINFPSTGNRLAFTLSGYLRATKARVTVDSLTPNISASVALVNNPVDRSKNTSFASASVNTLG